MLNREPITSETTATQSPVGSAAIYTDGHALTLRRGQLDILASSGMIRPHPGRGHDGITHDDYILGNGIAWADIYAAIGR